MSDKNENMINEGNELKPIRSKKDTALNILTIICSLAVIALIIFQFAGKIADAGIYYQPLMCVIMLIQACRFRKTNRSVAKLSLIAAILMAISTLIGIFTKIMIV